ncbi:heterokaryon incompatibility protein-domain-containing protein [Hypoxylon argillaceum]|nr:heterokaryon incompatibility protein-domain-containing protein [Hypoxylon argillaceum]
MADDLGHSLSTIRASYQQPLKNTPDSRSWATSLQGAHQRNTFTRRHINAFEEQEYVAISYTWNHPPNSTEPCGNYYVKSRSGLFIPSDVRDSVFERVRKYMIRYNLRYLWIDRECIMQEDSEEKKRAVQAMDLVYSYSKHPIGLLYQPIMSIAELELLAKLITWQSVIKSGSRYKLSSSLSPMARTKTLELLESIISDRWWTRAWTYQENYRGGTYMKLLIPHHISAKDYSDEYASLFGDIPGEIVLNSTEFHEVATAFCLALDSSVDLREAKERVLERVRKYNLLLEKPGSDGQDLATKSMSPSIIADVVKRHLSDPFDRLAIIANCCEYSVRLDSTELVKRRQSISLAILALFLLNGEILYNGPDHRTQDLDADNITNFLNVQAFSRYSPPRLRYGLTYNKGCRFIDAELTEHGTKTKGHLWKLGRVIDTSELPRALPYVEDGGMLERDERRRLKLLANVVKKMGYDHLNKEICRYLQSRQAPRHISFATQYQHQMAEKLAAAICQGRIIQLAALWDPSRSSPYCGIFICNHSSPAATPGYVFTASREREADKDRHLPNDTDRHVSLEVDYGMGKRGLPFLWTRSWVHGLCFFYGCPRIDVIFPWPSTIRI